MEKKFRIVTPEFDEKEYQRAALVDLATDVRTPADIIESSFSNPQLEQKQVYALKGITHLTWSAEIGTTRTVKETRWDNSRGRNVESTKTVTDWHLRNGNYDKETYGFSENCNSPDANESPFIATAVRTAKKSNVFEYDDADFDCEEPLDPTPAAQKLAEVSMIDSAKEDCEISLGYTRNFSASGYNELTLGSSYVFPKYKMNYTYKGKEYIHTAYGAGKFKSGGAFPDESINVEKRGEKLVLPFFIGAIVLSIISAIVSFTSDSLVFPIILFSLATLTMITDILLLKTIRHFNYKRNLNLKKESLISKLASMGLPPLCESEIASFKVGKNQEKTKKSSRRYITFYAYFSAFVSFGIRMPIAFVLLIIFIVFKGLWDLVNMFILANKNK